MKILYTRPSSPGWHPITMMVRLAAELFDAQLVEVPETATTRSRIQTLRGLLPRRHGVEALLVIAPKPQHLAAVLDLDVTSFGRMVGWTIDSMWSDRIPRVARGQRWFDALAITDGDLVDTWSPQTSTPVEWVPIGADVLGVDRRHLGGNRPVDLLRVGRQPAAYRHDDQTAAAAATRTLAFSPAPPIDPDAARNARALGDAFRSAKATLAFTTLVGDESWTHPTVEYLTPRWTDALANGAVVFGRLPACRAADELLWPGATHEIPPDDLAAGLDAVEAFARSWSPDLAIEQHRRALERLDWRHRFAQLAALLDVEPAPLARSLEELEAASTALGG